MTSRRHLTIVTDTSTFYGGEYAQGQSGDIVMIEPGLWSVLVCEDATTITFYTECSASQGVTLDAGAIVYYHAPDASISVDKAVVLNHVGKQDGVGRASSSRASIIRAGFVSG